MLLLLPLLPLLLLLRLVLLLLLLLLWLQPVLRLLLLLLLLLITATATAYWRHYAPDPCSSQCSGARTNANDHDAINKACGDFEAVVEGSGLSFQHLGQAQCWKFCRSH